MLQSARGTGASRGPGRRGASRGRARRRVAGCRPPPRAGRLKGMPHGFPAPPGERPRRWQYPVAALILLALAALAYWLRARA
jgi:hypothetical protein